MPADLRKLPAKSASGLGMLSVMTAIATKLLPLLCLALLGAQPALWLASTWHAPGYEGVGVWAFLLTVGLLLLSVRSGPSSRDAAQRQRNTLFVARLLLLSLLIRCIGALTGVNLVSALVLALDCYALARWLDCDARPLAVSPRWLALLFCFCLPLEPLVQRTMGYALQQLSAGLACGLLQGVGMAPECAGVRLQMNGVDVLVDLPCSGARLASLGGLVFAALAAWRRPSFLQGALGVAWLLLLVALGNSLRIAILALGISYQSVLPIDVMAEPWHSLVGLIMLALVTLGLWFWAQRLPWHLSLPTPVAPPAVHRVIVNRVQPLSTQATAISVLVLLGSSLLPLLQPASASAITSKTSNLHAPAFLGGFAQQGQALGELEQRYFRRYQAQASRSVYGPHGLYLVRTSAPLRHLHAPEICLRGLGHKVRFVGTRYDGVPHSVFESTAPDGHRYRVAVSYRSESGYVASSIAEAIWHWLRSPREHWTMIQRISPVGHADPGFEMAVRRAFNLFPSSDLPLDTQQLL